MDNKLKTDVIPTGYILRQWNTLLWDIVPGLKGRCGGTHAGWRKSRSSDVHRENLEAQMCIGTYCKHMASFYDPKNANLRTPTTSLPTSPLQPSNIKHRYLGLDTNVTGMYFGQVQVRSDTRGRRVFWSQWKLEKVFSRSKKFKSAVQSF